MRKGIQSLFMSRLRWGMPEHTDCCTAMLSSTCPPPITQEISVYKTSQGY